MLQVNYLCGPWELSPADISGRQCRDAPGRIRELGYLGTLVPEKILGQRKAGGGNWNAGRQRSKGEGIEQGTTRLL